LTPLLCARRPPRPTLFPYTTLFRSLLERHRLDHVAGPHRALIGAADIDRQHHQAAHVRLDLEFFAQAGVELAHGDAENASAARAAVAARRPAAVAAGDAGSAGAFFEQLDHRAQPHGPAVAHDVDFHLRADRGLADHAGQRPAVGDIAAAEAQHHVAGAQTGGGGRSIGRDAGDHRAAFAAIAGA